MPFGEDLNVGVGNRTGDTGLKYSMPGDNIRQKFTGYQKDNETQLDFAEARMYENRFGRFTAVDPLLASGKSANPQTFNRYVYIANRPNSATDPSGEIPEWVYDKSAEKGIIRPIWISNEEFAQGGYTEWERTIFSTSDGIVVLNRAGPINIDGVGEDYGWSLNGVPQGNGLYSALGALSDKTEGEIRALYNFIAKTLNSPVTTPIINPILMPGRDTSISGLLGFRPPFSTVEYRGTIQNIFGYGTETTATIGTLLLGTRSTTGTSSASLTNEQLIFKAADIADRRIPGVGNVAGTQKHTYARKLIERYESRFGNRGLGFEQSYSGGSPANYGDSGSVRFDVIDFQSMNAYDWKFGGGRLGQSRATQLRLNGPANLRSITGYNPRLGSTVY